MASATPRLPSALLPIFLLLLLLQMPPMLASFSESDLRGMYIFQFGAGTCPTRLTVSNDSLSLSAGDISINDSRCTSGGLSGALNPSSTRAGLVRYLRGTRSAGDIVAVSISQELSCSGRNLSTGSTLVFTSPDASFTVSWTRVFENNGTYLARNSPTGDAFVFERGRAYMVLDGLCMYNRIDIPNPPGRKCFPAAGLVATTRGVRRMDEVTVGMRVLGGGGRYSAVVAWTHRDGGWGAMVRVGLRGGAGVTLSEGHFLYVGGRLRRAGEVKVGDVVVRNGAPESVESVENVWVWGLYNPQTESGDIVVDGVLCSCYTEAVAIGVAHALLAPVRAAAAIGVDLSSVVSVV